MHINFRLKFSTLTFLGIFLLFSLGNGEADVQQKAPDFTLRDLSGNTVSLKDYRGQTVLLDFWATWCVPCRKSMPELVKLQKKYRNKGLVIFGLSIDNPQHYDNQYLLGFKKRLKINYRVLRADEKVIRDYLGAKPAGIPILFVIDREGRIADKVIGFSPGAAERSLKKLR